MSENIKFNKQVYNKEQYLKVIDTSFNQLIQPIADQIKAQPSVNDFFILYDTVFYLIPELGETNSHEYLIKKSSEYVDFEKDQTLINELQKEIAQLRTDLLDTQKLNVDLQVEIATVRSKIS
jgi:transcription initiation factor IIE alpha subunit